MAAEDMGTMILNHDADSQDGTMIINSGTMIMNDGTMIENNMGTMVINDETDDSTMKSMFSCEVCLHFGSRLTLSLGKWVSVMLNRN